MSLCVYGYFGVRIMSETHGSPVPHSRTLRVRTIMSRRRRRRRSVSRHVISGYNETCPSSGASGAVVSEADDKIKRFRLESREK